MEWQPIETAPKRTHILGWGKDYGIVMVTYDEPQSFASDNELDEMGEETASAENWFYADIGFGWGGRLEEKETPTHWMPLPEPPKEKS